MKFYFVQKTISFLLSLAMVVQLLVIPSFATEGVETVVDDEAPYSGEILVGINTNYTVGKISYSSTWSSLLSGAQSTGTISFSDELSLPDASQEMAANFSLDIAEIEADDTFYVDGTPTIMGYDENGYGIIDPNSILPDLAPEDLESLNKSLESTGIATMSTTETKSVKAYVSSSSSTETFELIYEGTYCKIWKLQGGDERFALTEEQAKEMAERYDTELYTQVITYFGDPLDLDKICNNDGKTDFYCYDLYGDGDTAVSSYVTGYFWATNVTANGADGVHLDSARGMGYDYSDPDSFELDYTLRLSTLVHELQHLVCYGILGNTDNYPTFLNEAFSESAPHLILGPESCSARVENFNNLNVEYPYYNNGKVALLLWNSYNYTMANYYYSYLFGQYICSQNDTSIYKEYLNAVKSVDSGYSQVDYVVYLAQFLGFDSVGDMMSSFYIALANPTGSGVYSFNNWDFAITPQVPVVSGSQSVIAGGVVYYDQTGDFTPSGAGSNMVFYSVSQDLEVENITLNVDNSAKTVYQVGDTLDVTGWSLDVDYSNGASETVAVTQEMVSGFDASTANDALVLTISYGGCSDSFTVVIEAEEDEYYAPAAEYYIQTGSGGNTDYTSGYQLILAFTNDATVGFTYDGTAMYDVSANGYKADDGAYYAYAFGLVVEGSADEGTVETVARSDDHIVLTCTENVNNSSAIDLRDAVAVMAVYLCTEVYFTHYINVVLQCDVNADGVVNTQDCASVLKAYLG